jgi:hypothetical protein
MVSIKHMIYPRDPAGNALVDTTLVSTDMTDIAFS